MALPKKGYKPGIYRFVSGTVDGNGDFSITNIPKDGYVSGIYQLTEVTIDADGNTSVEEDDIGITAAIEVTVDGSGDLSVTEVPEEGYVSGVYRVTTSTNIPKEGFNQIDFSAVIGTISGGKWESGPGIQFSAPLTHSLIPSPAVDSTYTFTRNDTDTTVTDFEGLVKDVTANEARFVGARRVENLATGLVTETITVISGNEYQVTIAGGSGDTCVASGAFTGTLTANGTNRISWNSGTPKTAASTSLTLTVTGTLTEMLVEDVTGQANQNPSENIVIGAEHGTNAGNVKYFNYQNNNTVDGSGVVTESQGTSIAAATLKGITIEQAGTNKSIHSENFTDTSWRITGSAVSGDVATSPSGYGTADKLQENTATAEHAVFQVIASTTSGVAHTFSVYAKADERDQIGIRSGNAAFPTPKAQVYYTLTGSGVATLDAGSPNAFGIEAVGNGWYRCWMTETTTSFGDASFVISLYKAGVLSYTGISGEGAFIWGAQFEQSPFVNSYVPTGVAAVTRNAESLSYPNTNILDDEGTLAFTFTPNGNTAQYTGGGDRALIGVRGVNNDLVHIDTTTGKLILSDGTNETVPTTLPDLVAGTATKIAIRWSATAGTMQIRQGAVEVSATFDGSMNKSAALRIGYSGAARANGSDKSLNVYNGAVSDSVFAGLTA